jgi:hypothetical protein
MIYNRSRGSHAKTYRWGPPDVVSHLDVGLAIDREARRIGVSRQAFIKLRLADLMTAR